MPVLLSIGAIGARLFNLPSQSPKPLMQFC